MAAAGLGEDLLLANEVLAMRRLGDVAGMPVALISLAAILLFTLPLSWRVQKGLQT